ncbi:alpha/beta hydrolase [Lysobacter sp. N42]|nr:alpha/beta hydrolase [Aliidiomarina sp. B3213]TCZ91019.1 alpha/beta hydrolase [Lysobacter sp. N42]
MEATVQGVPLRISLPESYFHSDEFKYPLLVVFDGSNQHDHVQGNVRFLSTFAVIPEMIIVSLDATSRLKDFSPTVIEGYEERSGGAQQFSTFIQEEVLNNLANQYRVADYRVVSGHSLSGLFTSYLALEKPYLFNAAISISPSLWWDNNYLSRNLEQFQIEDRPHVRWFLSIANEPGEMAEGFNLMSNALSAQSITNLEWFTESFENETHDTAPLYGNVEGLRQIFSGYNAVPNIEVKSLATLREFYQDLSEAFGFTFQMSAHQYNVYGLKAAYEGQLDWGIEILEQGTETFPRSDMLWDSLATAYDMNRQTEAAMAASTRALQLAIANNSKYLPAIRRQNESLRD